MRAVADLRLNNKIKPELDYRVDILLMREDKIKFDYPLHNKGFIYDAEAYAIEVKYLHKNADIGVVKNDFNKFGSLLHSNSDLFVVVLLETPNSEKMQKIEQFKLEAIENLKKGWGEFDLQRLHHRTISKV